MEVRRLVPLLVLAAIAWHGGGAVKKRAGGLLTARDKVITKQRMTSVLSAVMLDSAAGEGVTWSSQEEFRAYIKRSVRIRDGMSDPSLDFWGTPLHFEQDLRAQRLVVVSAGPDRRFNTRDDVRAQRSVGDF